MADAEDLQAFLKAYKDYMKNVLGPTRKELKSLFRPWWRTKDPDYWARYSQVGLPLPSPVQRVYARIKRPESVVDKIKRKPDSFKAGLMPESFKDMTDMVGVRVIAYFIAQLPLIDREIRNHESLEVSELDPPVAYMNKDLAGRLALARQEEKESGYVSIHYILRLRNSSVPPNDRPWFELQLRTLVEHTWGEVEHVLGYKADKTTSFAVRKQFQIISKSLGAIDEHFNFLYEELARFQQESKIFDSHPLNAENLPSVLAEAGLRCAQMEINGLLKLLVSRGVNTVGTLRGLAKRSRSVDIIKNLYSALKGNPPSTYEMVANLANLVGCDDDDEIAVRVKAQIEFSDAWDAWQSSEGREDEPRDPK